MGIRSEIAEDVIKEFVEEIERALQANAGKADVVVALRKLGRFALEGLEEAPEWEEKYEALFDAAASYKDQLLAMRVEDFFTLKRFLELGASASDAERALRAISNMQHSDFNVFGASEKAFQPLTTMREFLNHYPVRQPYAGSPNCGRKAVDAIILAIKSAGLPFEGDA